MTLLKSCSGAAVTRGIPLQAFRAAGHTLLLQSAGKMPAGPTAKMAVLQTVRKRE